MKHGTVLRKSLTYVGMSALAICIMTPVFFVFLSALKSPSDFFGGNVFRLPTAIQWSNLTRSFNVLKRYMLNGVIVSVIKVPLGIVIEASAAFALTRLRVRNPRLIFILFLIGMMIPIQITLVPLSVGFRVFGLGNTYLGLILVYLGFGIPFGILVLRGFFRTIPKELDESAIIDGATRMELFTRIILPLATAALATLMILDFLGTWNEFLLVNTLITADDMRTVPAGLFNFMREEYGIEYGLLTAGALISILPVLLIYVVFQRYFVEGLAGAIKG